ncbi:MAG: aminoacyl-tRNA hydrolase [Gammaproteobacteria bacterium]|nr:aminoacyl-tRNA hydrolase [Gammaproteobacteria bacterium]
MQGPIQLIVGLGNPGPEYAATRHNAGFWFIETLARQYGATLRADSKFHGLVSNANIQGQSCLLLQPTTFMNHSGLAVSHVAHYYKIKPETILVAHDELDLLCGDVKLKWSGGHAGHNGLRDITQALKSQNFARLRLGIGHPGHKDKVLNYVLGQASTSERNKIETAIDKSLTVLPKVLIGAWEQAVQELHTP